VKGEWQTEDEKLKFYKDYLSKLANEFEEIKFTHISRDKNQFVDALATLALMTNKYWKQDPTNKHWNQKSSSSLLFTRWVTKWH